MKTRFAMLASVLLLLAIGSVSAADAKAQVQPKLQPKPDLQRLDEVTRALMAQYHIPGIGIVGVKGGDVVYLKGFGTSDGSHAFGPGTPFYIASNTKSFTGLAMARLLTQGRIHLDDPVTRYLPAARFPPDVDADAVTVRDLLAHTTGWANDPMVSRTAYSGELSDDLGALLRFTQYRQDDHGKGFKYSNLGYLLSGMVIEEVTGRDWQHYVKEAVLEPAGMTQTASRVPDAGAGAALPFEAGSPMPLDFRKTDATMHAAGGLYATLGDMGRWLTLFTDPRQQRVPAAVIERASTSLVDDVDGGMGPFKLQGYGFGWIHGSVWSTTPLRLHFGSFPGYESMESYMPDAQLGVFVYVNERIGGVRVAATLSNLFYDLMRDDPSTDAHLAGLEKMLAGTYATDDTPAPVLLSRSQRPGLCGRYVSQAYGTMTIQALGDGYRVSLGDLHGRAYRGEGDRQFRVDWIPGKLEPFDVEDRKGHSVLQYGDYGQFERLEPQPAGEC